MTPRPPARAGTTAFYTRVIGLAGAGWMFDAMDGTLLAILLPALISAFSLTTAEAGALASVDRVGALVGAAVAGLLADRWGRRATLQLMLLVYSVGTGVLALANGVLMFAAIRLIVGVGLGGELPAAATLAAELLPRKHRGFLMGVFNSFFNGGFILATIVGLVIAAPFGWRAALVVGAAPSLLVVLLRRYLPESPRHPPMRRMRDQLGPLLLAYGRTVKLLAATWFALYFIAYAVYAWLPTLLVARGLSYVVSLQYTLLAGAAQIAGNLTAGYLADRFGRRSSLVALLALAATSAWAFGLMQGPLESLAFVVALGFFAAGAFGVATAYTPELFATPVRGSGVGVTTAIGRVGGVLAPLTVGIVLQTFPGPQGQVVVFALISVCFVAAAIAVLFLDLETKGRDLDEGATLLASP